MYAETRILGIIFKKVLKIYGTFETAMKCITKGELRI